MSKKLTKSLFVLTVMALSAASTAQAAGRFGGACYVRHQAPTPQASPSSAASTGVVYKVVQQTPQYDFRRPEIVSGARVTLFANFLRQEQGCVLFNLNGTSTECNVVEWTPSSVTVELPRLGLLEPKNAVIQIILPDGRVAKTFPVLYISQPDIVVHEETVAVPSPPAPATRGAVYATSVRGGLILEAGSE